MTKNNKKDLRKWQIKKLSAEIITIIIIVIGIVIFVQSFMTGGAEYDSWKCILGFAITISGLAIWPDVYYMKYKKK